MENNKQPIKLENNNENKLTIYEYEQKYSKRQNLKGIKFLLSLLVAIVLFVILACFFQIFKVVYDINEYAGYGVAAVLIVLFIAFIIIPVVKISKLEYFETNVNVYNAKEAKKKNKQIRREISDKMIELTQSVDGIGWYNSEEIGKLAIYRHNNDDESIKQLLSKMYTGSIKKTAKEIIVQKSVQAGVYSAISQSDALDTVFITTINLQLIKDIIYLYGFRPSDAALVKIFSNILRNAIIAYGLGNAKIGKGITKTIGGITRDIPILGSAISLLIDASIQGLLNGTMTAIIGYETIKYLNYEYKLQNILDGINITESEEEAQNTYEEIKDQLKQKTSKLESI